MNTETPVPPEILKKYDSEQGLVEKHIVRELVMRNAEGNVSLSMGNYFTETDAKELVREVLSYDFSVPDEYKSK